MALTRTTLAAACTSSQLVLTVTSTSSGFPAVGAYANPTQMMQIDSEYMLIQVVPVSGTVNVMQRGYNGSKAVAHDILAPIATSSLASDFAAIAGGEVVNRPPDFPLQVSLGQDGALAVPVKNTSVVINKATACLFTLAAPGKDQDGLRLDITSDTAAAHVLTATTLLNNGLSGSPWTTATWAAQKGASLPLMAVDGVWNVIGTANAVTLT